MRIGVDAFTFAGLEAGVSRYLTEVLTVLMRASPQDEFTLYSPVPIVVPSLPRTCEVRLPRGWRKVVPGFWSLDTLPRLVCADEIEVFWGQNSTLPLRLRRPCRRVLTVHDLTTMVFPETMDAKQRVSSGVRLRALVRAADTIVADSHATARLLNRLLSVSMSKIEVVHLGCTGAIGPLPAGVARRAVRERFALPDDFMLTVGTLEPRKDHATLMEALTLKKGLPLLVIVGGVGWKSRSIVSLVEAAEAKGLVRFLGRVTDSELAALYGAARLLVYPSLYEGFGLPVLEAMVCGCPVLCSWSSSLPEVGGRAARYFRPHDARDLAGRLDELVSDESRAAEMRARGFAQAARFGYDRAARELFKLFHGIR